MFENTYRLPHLLTASPAERQAVLYALWLLEQRGVSTSPLTRAQVYTNKWTVGEVLFDSMGKYWKEPIDGNCENTLRVQFTGPSMVEWKSQCQACLDKAQQNKSKIIKIQGVTITQKWNWTEAHKRYVAKTLRDMTKPMGYVSRFLTKFPGEGNYSKAFMP